MSGFWPTGMVDRIALDQHRAGFEVFVWCAKCQAFTMPIGLATCERAGHRRSSPAPGKVYR